MRRFLALLCMVAVMGAAAPSPASAAGGKMLHPMKHCANC